MSFVVVIVHYLSEAFVYGTAPLTIGVITPLCVAGVSLVWMLIVHWLMAADRRAADAAVRENFPRRVEDIPLMCSGKQRHAVYKAD